MEEVCVGEVGQALWRSAQCGGGELREDPGVLAGDLHRGRPHVGDHLQLLGSIGP